MNKLTSGAGALCLALAAVSVFATDAAARARVSAARPSSSHPAIRQALSWYGKDMEKDVRDGHTPHVIVMGVNGRVTRDTQYDHGSGKAGLMKVTGLGSSGKFKVVMLLPVSGHVSWAEAQRYARRNRYNVTVGDDQGRTWWRTPKVRSTGLVTPKLFDLKLRPGKNVLDFWADGSGGAGGYVEGRRYVIHWDGK